jgi:hypothetical protein
MSSKSPESKITIDNDKEDQDADEKKSDRLVINWPTVFRNDRSLKLSLLEKVFTVPFVNYLFLFRF